MNYEVQNNVLYRGNKNIHVSLHLAQKRKPPLFCYNFIKYWSIFSRPYCTQYDQLLAW